MNAWQSAWQCKRFVIVTETFPGLPVVLEFLTRDNWVLVCSPECLCLFQTCQSCFKTIPKGDVVVLAEFDENEVSCYHAACFCCSTCWELLVDLTYYRYGNKVYCGRHHAELSRQRCFGCDEVRSNAVFHLYITMQKCSIGPLRDLFLFRTFWRGRGGGLFHIIYLNRTYKINKADFWMFKCCMGNAFLQIATIIIKGDRWITLKELSCPYHLGRGKLIETEAY